MTDSGDDLDLPYADAVEELEEILSHLEDNSVDVDVLADRVARGAELVRHCRQRLRTVRSEVNAVVEELLDDGAATEGGRS